MRYEIDSHTHTIASGHAYNTIIEMADAAKKAGLKGICITDHGPAMAGSCSAMNFCNFSVIDRDYFDIVVLMGVELNITDFSGAVDLPKRLLKRMDIALACIHSQCIEYGRGIEENTAAALGAMSNPFVDVIGHPDDSDFPLDYTSLVKKSLETGALLEVNENSFRQPGVRRDSEKNVRAYLALCKKEGVPVVVGSDAHFVTRVGDCSRVAALMQDANFPEELVLNSDVVKFAEYMRKRKDAALKALG